MTIVPPTPFPGATGVSDKTAFDRRELGLILSVYGRMVAAGEWRDYGLSFLRDVAVFSVFRRTAEYPLYRIEKRPRLRTRRRMWSLSLPSWAWVPPIGRPRHAARSSA